MIKKIVIREDNVTNIKVWYYPNDFWCTEPLYDFKDGDKVDVIYEILLVNELSMRYWIRPIWKSNSKTEKDV